MNIKKGFFATSEPLDDGWYWRKIQDDDPTPGIVEVCNGWFSDTRPTDSYGAHWEVYESDDFKGWLWCGPIKPPVSINKL